jgi:outer membrane biosynthesis protein TonB
VHDPVDAADISIPGLHGTVKFTFQDGVIEYPEITASTGDPELDKLMLHQVASAQVPRPTGLKTDQPHEFELDLAMPTPYETFQSGIYDAFDAYKIYSREAVMGGYQSATTVGFDYLDGTLSNVVVTKSSKSKELDKRSLWTVTAAKLPSTPDAYVGKTLHMQASFCYALYQTEAESGRCPVARDVIWVTGTRIRRVN